MKLSFKHTPSQEVTTFHEHWKDSVPNVGHDVTYKNKKGKTISGIVQFVSWDFDKHEIIVAIK